MTRHTCEDLTQCSHIRRLSSHYSQNQGINPDWCKQNRVLFSCGHVYSEDKRALPFGGGWRPGVWGSPICCLHYVSAAVSCSGPKWSTYMRDSAVDSRLQFDLLINVSNSIESLHPLPIYRHTYDKKVRECGEY